MTTRRRQARQPAGRRAPDTLGACIGQGDIGRSGAKRQGGLTGALVGGVMALVALLVWYLVVVQAIRGRRSAAFTTPLAAVS